MALYALTTVYLYHFPSLARTRFAIVLVVIQAAPFVAYAALHDRPAQRIGIRPAAAAVTVAAAEASYLVRKSLSSPGRGGGRPGPRRASTGSRRAPAPAQGRARPPLRARPCQCRQPDRARSRSRPRP